MLKFSFFSNYLLFNLPISSINIIQGWILTTKENTAAVSSWLSPYHLSVKMLISRFIKHVLVSFAVALAIIVLPHPGGPYNKTPFGAWVNWESSNNSFLWIGKITVSLSSWIICSWPAIFSQDNLLIDLDR